MFNNNNSGLRDATIGHPTYDVYYDYEYDKLYNTKGVKDLLAHYPPTGNYSNRFNNAYQPNTYYQGIYGASKYKGLSSTIRNSIKQQSKFRMYQH